MILLALDKSPKIYHYNVILLFDLPISLEVESCKDFLLDFKKVVKQKPNFNMIIKLLSIIIDFKRS